MEYVVGPVIALLVAMKFTDYKSKETQAAITDHISVVDKKITEQNEAMSGQTLKIVMPVAKAVSRINQQLGL